VGLTIATSIPAAVISMAFLGLFPGSNIRENNIVQTVCSAAGALASVIFILPSLVIIGWWTGFPFWTSFLLCASGGVLGVLFTIPLRRALVTQSDLPYPEGVAAAEVLKVGADMRAENPEAREGLQAVVYGALASGGLAIAVAMRLAADGARGFFKTGAVAASGYTFSYSLALVGAGHLVGISVGLAMFAGIAIAWAGAVPILTAMTPMHGDLASFVTGIWRNDVRFIGAGAMAATRRGAPPPVRAGRDHVRGWRAANKLADETPRANRLISTAPTRGPVRIHPRNRTSVPSCRGSGHLGPHGSAQWLRQSESPSN